jgi:ribosomal protein S18 acetylase RimI-like enzyme
MSDVVIRGRTEDDLDALVEAAARVAREDGYPSRWPDDPRAWLRTRDPLGAWVAERAGEMLGHVVLRGPSDHRPVRMWCEQTREDPQGCCVVSRLFVVAAGRGQGVGQALLETVCAAADERGLYPVLDVVETNRAAVRLYHRLGWTKIGTYVDTFHDSAGPEQLLCFAAPQRN